MNNKNLKKQNFYNLQICKILQKAREFFDKKIKFE